MSIRIGVDLDNTLACVDPLYGEVAQRLGFGAFDGEGKAAVKQALIGPDGDETRWQTVQGQVFGALYHRARPFPGAHSTLSTWLKSGHEVVIVSHKTRRGHYDASGSDLHAISRQWLRACGLVGPGLLHEADVHFEETREGKIQTIRDLGCNVFIDDLPEVLEHERFPPECLPILFASGGVVPEASRLTASCWDDLRTLVAALEASR